LKSILIVDDHLTNRQLIVSLISRRGYRPLEASDGAEALAMVRAEHPELVISDILMPTVDGFEFVRRLRADPSIAQTKVIFYTATYREREAEELARMGGVFRVISKPCKPVEMLQAIEQALARAPAEMPASIESTFDREHVRLMTDKLSAHAAALRRAQHVAKLAHVITRPDGSFESWSDTLRELTGLDDEHMPRSTREWLQIIHPDHREAFRAKCIAAARSGLRTEVEYQLRRSDGTWTSMFQVIEPMLGETHSDDGRRWFSTLQDISALKRAEEEVRRLNADLERCVAERTSELEAAMKDLESFDYSISHDLRAPIDRIRGFTSVLAADYSGCLDDRGRDLLRRVIAASESMEQLVGDLFSLSTVSRGELRRTEVDMTALAQAIIAELMRAQPGRSVAVEIEAGLFARADPGLLRIVLENLLGNAWKFTGRRDGAKIEVGCDRSMANAIFFVRDNGEGFDSNLAAKLFAPFQRLHSKSEFEGTGIGLATVNRIVSRHGGRVWAEGAVGVGATILFTLSA
jgi:PAS domain S-box-containing protein